MEFVWDDKKASLNLTKHGISFNEAASVFDDESGLVIFDPDHSQSEDRFIILGISCSLRLLVVCHCYRENDEQIRIISARKATKNEASCYNGRK